MAAATKAAPLVPTITNPHVAPPATSTSPVITPTTPSTLRVTKKLRKRSAVSRSYLVVTGNSLSFEYG